MKRLAFLSIFIFIAISLFSNPKEADFTFNINQRKTFWVVVPGLGWLFTDVDGDFDQTPILRGKDFNADATHFLFKFTAIGDYYFRFDYQNFEPLLPGKTIFENELGFTTREVWVKIIDEKKSNRVFSKPDHIAISQIIDLPAVEEVEPAVVEEVLPITEEGEFRWKSHELYPSLEEIKVLLDGMADENVRSLFQLGLYYFQLNTPKGMRQSYDYFNEISSRFPASSLSEESKARADYIHNYYFLIR